MGTKSGGERTPPKTKTPTFLLELPLVVSARQAARQRAHLEAGRQFYNSVLSAGQRRLRQMRADPAWQEARTIPRTHTQERRAAFSVLRERYGFSEYACARAGTRAACLLAGRASGCCAGPEACDPRLSSPQPGLRRHSPPGTLQESWPWA